MDEKCIRIDMSKLIFKPKEELDKMDLKEIKEYLDGLESSGIYDGYTSLYSKAYHAYLKNVVSPISDKWKEELGFYEYCEIAYGITKETIDYLLNNEDKIGKEHSPHRQWTEIYKKHNPGETSIKGMESVPKDTTDIKTVKINPVEFMNKYKDDKQPDSILEKIAFDKNLKTDSIR